jgi:hypothetical protein
VQVAAGPEYSFCTAAVKPSMSWKVGSEAYRPNCPAPPPSPLLAVCTVVRSRRSISRGRLFGSHLNWGLAKTQRTRPAGGSSHLAWRVPLPKQGSLERTAAGQAGLHRVKGSPEVCITVASSPKLLQQQRAAQGGGIWEGGS